MTKPPITLRRLIAQQLLQPKFDSAVDLMAWMTAIQAQDHAGAKWGLGLRFPRSTEGEIDAALQAKKIVRNWVPRGTLHFVTGADLGWLLALLAPGIIAANARRYRELELDEETLSRSSRCLAHLLQNEGELTRKQLLAQLEVQGIRTTGQRAPYLLQRASLDGLIAHARVRRGDPIYFLLDDLHVTDQSFDRAAGLAELARRYFITRGPATVQDFIWWSGLPAGEARLGIEAAGAHLLHETIEGREVWFTDPPHGGLSDTPTVHLLPRFDEYLFSYRDRSAAVDPGLGPRLRLGGLPNAPIVLDGRVVGIWRLTLRKNVIELNTELFTRLTRVDNEALVEAAGRLATFYRLALKLSGPAGD